MCGQETIMTQYLRETKKWPSSGREGIWLHSSYLRVSRAETLRTGLEKRAGAAAGSFLLSQHSQREEAGVTVGRIHHFGVLSSAVFYREWSSALESSPCTGTWLTPSLTKQMTPPHLLRCLRGNPQILERGRQFSPAS